MKIHHELEAPAADRPLALAIGFFDGYHRGHREIVRALLRARKVGWRAAILTFRNHPATLLRPDRVPALITTVEERVNLLAETGIDELFLVPFDERVAKLEAREFCDVLLATMGVRTLAVGANFRFGKDRGGDVALASDIFAERGARVEAVPALLAGGERISSTRVRAAIAAGDMAAADGLLANPYTLRGRVELGAGRGHDLGFPTANLAVPPEKSLPPDGVYRVTGRYDGRSYGGLVSIGTNPTFGTNPRTVEAWLLDFRETIYGEELELRDFRFLREQRTFASAADLRRQIDEDAGHVHFPSFSTAPVVGVSTS